MIDDLERIDLEEDYEREDEIEELTHVDTELPFVRIRKMNRDSRKRVRF